MLEILVPYLFLQQFYGSQLFLRQRVDMRIVNFDEDIEYEDIPSLQIVIKAIPFENNYVPSLVIMSPNDQYPMSIDELNALMDGIEIAKNKIDEIITYILKTKIFDTNGKDMYEFNPDDYEDLGEVEDDE